MPITIRKNTYSGGNAATFQPILAYQSHAIYCDENNSEYGYTDNFNYIDQDPWSVSFWVKKDGIPTFPENFLFIQGWSIIISFGRTDGYLLYAARSPINGSRERMTGSTNICDNEWHHIAITNAMNYPASLGLVLIVDGTMDGEEDCGLTDSILNVDDEDHIMIGFNSGAPAYYSLSFDELAIWNDYSLHGSEVLTLYNSGSPLADSATTTNIDSSLVGYWKFQEGAGISVDDETSEDNDIGLFNTPSWITGA